MNLTKLDFGDETVLRIRTDFLKDSVYRVVVQESGSKGSRHSVLTDAARRTSWGHFDVYAMGAFGSATER